MKKLPAIVYQMCVHGALIVGSYAKQLIGEDIDCNDFDLLIPYEKWQVVSLLIPSDAVLNKFGGWRFSIGKDEIDVWPGSLLVYLSECKTKYGGRVVAVDYINNRIFSSSLFDFDSSCQPITEGR